MTHYIVCLDLDCFYAQVAEHCCPEYRNHPIGVQQKHIIVTCNYPARARGVGKLQLVSDALKACPELFIFDGHNLDVFREAHEKLFETLTTHGYDIEKLGMDEFFLDITKSVNERFKISPRANKPVGHVLGQYSPESNEISKKLSIASQICSEIRKDLFQKTGYTCGGGISTSKIMAKLISSYKKPNQQTVLMDEHKQIFLDCKPVKYVMGIGRKTQQQLLDDFGVSLIQELRFIPLAELKQRFGDRIGNYLHSASNGEDFPKGVKAYSGVKSLSVEDSFQNVRTWVQIDEVLKKLCAHLWEKMKKLYEENGQKATKAVCSVRPTAAERGYMHRISKTVDMPSLLFRDKESECVLLKKVYMKACKELLPGTGWLIKALNIQGKNLTKKRRMKGGLDNFFVKRPKLAKPKKIPKAEHNQAGTKMTKESLRKSQSKALHLLGYTGSPKKKPLPPKKIKKHKGIEKFFKLPKDPGIKSKERVKVSNRGSKSKVKAKGRLLTMFAQAADKKVSMVACPICQKQIPESKINRHLDSCLT